MLRNALMHFATCFLGPFEGIVEAEIFPGRWDELGGFCYYVRGGNTIRKTQA